MKLSFIILISTLLMLSCSKVEPAIKSVLDNAETIMTDNPEEALSLLGNIDRSSIHSREIEARYALALSEALDRNYIDIDNDSLIRIAHSYYLKSKDIRRKAGSSYYLGRVQFNGCNYESAVVSFLDALRYAQNLNDHCLMGLIHSQLGLIYEYQEIFDEVIKHYTKATKEFQQTKLTPHIIHSFNVLGTAYQYVGEYEKALENKKTGLNLAVENKDTISIIRISQEISGIHYILKDYDKSQKYLLDLYSRFDQNIVDNDLSGRILLVANYIKQGQFENARKILANIDLPMLDDEVRAGTVFQKYELERKSGNYEKALDHFVDYYSICDSLWNANQGEAILEIERKYEKTLLEYDNYRHLTQKRYLIIGIITIILTVFLIGWHLYRRHKHIILDRDRQIQDYLIALNEADNQLSNLNISREKELKLKEILTKRLNLLRDYYDIIFSWQSRPKIMQKKIDELTSIASIESETFEILKDIVNERHPDFINKLKSIHPELSNADIDLICLIITNFSSQQMSAVYNTNSIQSIYTKKYRLSLKLGVESVKTLKPYLHTILS